MLTSRDWLMGAGPGEDYDHLVDPSDPEQALAAAIDTGSAGRPFIAMHRKQLGEQL